MAKRSQASSDSGGGWRVALLLVAFFAIGAGAALLIRHPELLQTAGVGRLIDRTVTSAYTPEPQFDFRADYAPRPMPRCGSGPRINCIVDGDTLWLDGEKIRLVNIDAPEMNGRCRAESVRATDAQSELARLLSDRPIAISTQGYDRYGRTLAAVATPEGDVGAALVAGRLAVDWHGRKEPAATWCAF